MPKVKGKFLYFTYVKCKLSKIVPDPNVCTRICDATLACHETFKRGLFFLKVFCIHLQDIQIPLPTLDHSLMTSCLEQVCEKIQTGIKCKVIELTRYNSEKVFFDIYPSKVDVRGKSNLKRLMAEQMLTIVSTDVSVRFESRCANLCRSVGDLSKKYACRVVRSAFSGNWEDVPISCESPLKRVLPDDPLKGNTFYDLKARPERYFVTTTKL